MDPPKNDVPKLPDMIMCGDHPSFTKTELNVKEKEEKPWDKPKSPMTYARISPSSSRTERSEAAGGGGRAEGRAEARSEHALRLLEARRRVRSLDAVPRSDQDQRATPPNRALVQAALGSFRWPPYLLCVWVIVLVLTHMLHCLVSLLERSLPNIKKFCQYFKTWAEDSWKIEKDTTHRVYPIALAVLAGLMYTVYYCMFMLYSIAVWSIEPLCSELEETKSSIDVMETKVTNYMEEANSKTNFKA